MFLTSPLIDQAIALIDLPLPGIDTLHRGGADFVLRTGLLGSEDMKNALLPALILIALVGCSSRDNYRLDAFKRLDNGTITFDLTRREQHIKAVCNASESECSDLALRAGNSIDCYVHASAPSPDAYGVKVDPYVGSGLVCHVRRQI
jgi:hypothetical protein